jgi:chromosomal replication initiation ATPase DnaA
VISGATVDRLLDHEVSRGPRRPVKFEAILSAVVGYFGATSRQVLGSGRNSRLVLARSVLVHLARKLTPMSYPEIAAQMGRRNHSTVITAAQRIEKQIANGETLRLSGLPGAGTTAGLGGPMTVSDLVIDVQRAIPM